MKMDVSDKINNCMIAECWHLQTTF